MSRRARGDGALRARLLITGAGTGTANNVIESLRAGAPGLAIVGCHHDRFALKQSLAERNYLVPPDDHRSFISALGAVARRERIDVVLPTRDAAALALARRRRALPCRTFLPRTRTLALCQDKARVSARLRARGVPAPATWPVTALSRVERAFERLAPHGLVWCRARSGSGSLGATAVKTPEQARSWIRLWAELRGVPVRAFTLCEYLPGRDFGCQSLWRDGRLLLVKTFERVSYFAAGGTLSGTSSVAALAKSVDEPRVVEVVTAAIRAVDPRASGMYQTDCKENADGVPSVTEINAGRFGLSTPLFDLVGRHNMAVAFVRAALGQAEAFTPVYDAAPGHYLVRDLDTLPRIFSTEELFSDIKDARGL